MVCRIGWASLWPSMHLFGHLCILASLHLSSKMKLPKRIIIHLFKEGNNQCSPCGSKLRRPGSNLDINLTSQPSIDYSYSPTSYKREKLGGCMGAIDVREIPRFGPCKGQSKSHYLTRWWSKLMARVSGSIHMGYNRWCPCSCVQQLLV